MLIPHHRSSSFLRVLFLTVLLWGVGLPGQQWSWAVPPEGGRSMVSLGSGESSWRESLDKMRDPIENLHLNAWLFSEMLIKMHRPRTGSIMSQRNEFNLQVTYSLTENVKLYTWLRPFWDSIYDWKGGSLTERNGRTLRDKWGDNFDLDNTTRHDPLIREAYVDLTYGDFGARLGRQIVAWGKSDGVFLLDNISPFNYREPLRFQEQEIKIPQWMINLNYRFGTVGIVQFLWLPDPQFADYPGRDPLTPDGRPNCQHDFEFNIVCLTNKTFVAFDQIFKDNGIVGAHGQVGFPFPVMKKPPHTLADSAYMVRFDSEYRGLTYSLVYEYKYNWFLQDLPDLGRGEGAIGRGKAALAIGNVRKAQRIHIIGAAMDYQFAWLPIFGERTVMRAETGVIVNDIFFTPNFDAVQKERYQILIGFDKFLIDPPWLNFPQLGLGPGSGASWFFSLQVFQDWVLDPDRWNNAYITGGANNFSFEKFRATNGLRGATQTFVTLFLGKDMLADQSLNVEQFLLIDPGFGDVWEHIQLKYMLNDWTTLALGYNKTWGALSNPFGSNRAVDYMWTSVTFGL